MENMEKELIRCPSCGATLKNENNLDIFYCEYCGERIIYRGFSDEAYRTRAKYRQYEHEEYKMNHESHEKDLDIEREFKRAKQEIEVKKLKDKYVDQSAFRFLLVMGLMMMLLGGSLMIDDKKETERNNAIYQNAVQLYQNGQYDDALTALDSINSSSMEERVNNLIMEIKQAKVDTMEEEDKYVALLLSSSDFTGMNYKDAVEYLTDLGFFKISTVKTQYGGLFAKENRVTSINIEGHTSFSKSATAKLDSKIVITYYSSSA